MNEKNKKNTADAEAGAIGLIQPEQAQLAHPAVISKSLSAFHCPHHQQKHKYNGSFLPHLVMFDGFFCFCFGLWRTARGRGNRRKYLKARFQGFSPIGAAMPKAFALKQSVFNVFVQTT